MAVLSSMQAFFDKVDSNTARFIQRLGDACAIKSISGEVKCRPKVFEMGEWLANEMGRLGIQVKKVDPGHQVLEGQTISLPPILLGTLGDDPNKKTLLVYGHYDVQPADITDGWKTEPFKLVEDETGRLIARGSSDDKGPILAWLNAIEALQELGQEIPINIKFCFEGMEESGSEGLDDVIYREASAYFKNVDCVCISDNYWLGKTKPCITYGLRGISYFTVAISGPGRDLHSGVFGGTVHEPMTDLVHIMSKLVDPKGQILIPGISDSVAPLTEDELKRYQTLEFSHNDFHAALEAENSIHSNEIDTLMRRWRYPSLSLHGIEGAFYGSGAKTVIPAKVMGKFSIRTVPNQTPDVISKLVKDYVEKLFKELGSKNKLEVVPHHGGKPWVGDVNHWNYESAHKAIKAVFGVEPDYTREGGSIPVTLTFQEALHKNVLLLPIGACDDGAHSINEKIDKSNYINGVKLLGAYMFELGQVCH